MFCIHSPHWIATPCTPAGVREAYSNSTADDLERGELCKMWLIKCHTNGQHSCSQYLLPRYANVQLDIPYGHFKTFNYDILSVYEVFTAHSSWVGVALVRKATNSEIICGRVIQGGCRSSYPLQHAIIGFSCFESAASGYLSRNHCNDDNPLVLHRHGNKRKY